MKPAKSVSVKFIIHINSRVQDFVYVLLTQNSAAEALGSGSRPVNALSVNRKIYSTEENGWNSMITLI